jgi:hypothetical protein
MTEAIELKTGIPVDYEDPEYAWENDLNDVTAVIAKRPGSHRTLVPRGGRIVLTPVGNAKGKASMSQAIAMMEAAIGQHHALQLPGTFGVVQVGQRLQLRAAGVKDKAGVLHNDPNVLDSRISLPAQQWTGMEALVYICKQLSIATKKDVEIGQVPLSLLSQLVATLAANNESAREVLLRLLTNLQQRYAIAPKVPLFSWQFCYAPDDKRFFLNMRVVRAEEPSPFGGVTVQTIYR